MRKTVIFSALLLAAAAAPDSGWSWGAEGKNEVKNEEIIRSPRLEQASFPSVEISNENIQSPLPLEPHTNEHVQSVVSESNREARFLGLSDTLCEWGVGSSCKQKAKKKKGNGYPHTLPSQYGVPAPYDQYDYQNTYQNTAQIHNSYQPVPQKQKGNKKKKGGSGVTDFISGFLNSYTKPKKDKVKIKGYIPTDVPTLIVPNHHIELQNFGSNSYLETLPTYESALPAYVPPTGVYSPPIQNVQGTYASTNHHVKGTYSPPSHSIKGGFSSNQHIKGSYSNQHLKGTYPVPNKHVSVTTNTNFNAGKSSYAVPKPTHVTSKGFNQKVAFVGQKKVPSHQNPTYIVKQPVVTKVLTQTVGGPVDATKVQHLHSHTHVYHGSQVIEPGKQLQKKSDNIGGATSFVAQESSSFVSNPNDLTAGNNPFNSQSTGHLSQTHITSQQGHNTHVQGNTQHSSGVNSHTQFISQNGGFSASQFQPPSHTEFGFNPSSATIEDMINANKIYTEFSRTIYEEDCHCVSEQFCAAENIVHGRRDLTNVIDARNQESQIFSNASSVEQPEVNEVEYSARSGRSFDINSNSTTTEKVESLELTTDDESNTTELPEVSRNRREAENSTANFEDVQGRQLSGYTPGKTGCRAGSVCCKRPVYGKSSPARSLPVCGRSNDENILARIKTKNHENGRAGFGEYPWQAAILRKSEGELVYVCGASLISDRFLITAAHCVNKIEKELLRVRLGEWDVRDRSEFYPHVESDVSGLIIHPEFYEGNLENDIAIMKIADPVDYTKYPHISPVCLPPPESDFSNQVCTITGWGKDGWGSKGEFQAILKETKVPVVHHQVCQQILQGTKLGGSYSLHEGMLCAGGEENKDACKGDGGGPLVCRGTNKEYILAGVVSWGLGCGEQGIPGVYVDVAKYVKWVQTITG